MQTQSKKIIEIKAVTWSKDSHGLFDYESKHLNIKKINVDSQCKLFREGTEIVTSNDNQGAKMEEENLKHLISITTNENQSDKFYISPNKFATSSIPGILTEEQMSNFKNNEAYLIVRSFKNSDGVQKGYVLEPGEIIKLGRIEYAVLEYRLENNEVRTMETNTDLFYGNKIYTKDKEYDKLHQCRICLQEELPEEHGEILINPCKCKGSCEFVHFNCLKRWIESKITTKYIDASSTSILYTWKRLECEVCKEPLPKKIRYRDRVIDLISILKPDYPYLILENISREKRVSKGIILIQPNTTPEHNIKMGRGHQCDVRISDISVSRLHALIKYENGHFVVFDNNSKFGTLILLNKPYLIKTEKVAIQVGRTVMTFALKNNAPLPSMSSPSQASTTTNFSEALGSKGSYSSKPSLRQYMSVARKSKELKTNTNPKAMEEEDDDIQAMSDIEKE